MMQISRVQHSTLIASQVRKFCEGMRDLQLQILFRIPKGIPTHSIRP